MSNISNTQKDVFHCHNFPGETLCFGSYLLPSLSTEADSFQNVVLVF
jgi:hypothetical protein